MFKQQLSPRSVHPYQTTVVPRSDQQFISATQQRIKYPWTEDNSSVYQIPGTDSSTSDNAYQIPQYNRVLTDYSPTSPSYQAPYIGTWRSNKKGKFSVDNIDASNVSQCVSTFALPFYNNDPHLRAVSDSPIPPVTPELPIMGACGGHCPGFEYVCYYILQVIFVVGILTGISLCVAGIVLRKTNRNGDLGVLVYIGSLSSCVCAVLLGVQCCVRREIRQRKLRASVHIPMQPMQEPAPASPMLTSTLPQRSQVFRAASPLYPDEDDAGVAWWRTNHRD